MGRDFKYILLISISLGFSSCDSSEKSVANDEFSIEGQTEDGFEDGTYCANVTYHNPNTGTTNEYTLDVEVSNNRVIRINWSNGGWMDGWMEIIFHLKHLAIQGTVHLKAIRGMNTPFK